MPDDPNFNALLPEDADQIIEPVEFDFGLKRRTFVQLVATGIAVVVSAPSQAQQRGGGQRGTTQVRNLSERLHIGKDGMVTLLCGKVEIGQGSRAEFTQAAAEELRVPVNQVQVTLSDTGLTPNDGNTAGSGSTPRTVPALRNACAAAREVLIDLAAKRWEVARDTVQLREGKFCHSGSNRTLTLAELAQSDELPKAFEQAPVSGATLTAITDWKVLGTSIPRPNARDLITSTHRYPSDIKRPGMLRGKVLRPPSYGAKLVSIDLAPAKDMKDVVVIQDGDFVGVVAPTTYQAQKALAAIAGTAKWGSTAHPSSKEVYSFLRERVPGGAPKNGFTDELAAAKKSLRATYHTAYIQHAPMETRAAVAEWQDDHLTVWTGTQNPFGHKSELVRAFRLAEDKVRVIVPDTGGGFGGKHTGEVSVEVARLAKAAGKPVSLKWTRAEEFTWAVFRPAAVIDAEATLDEHGKLTSWYFININSGASAVQTPYRAGRTRAETVSSNPPLRHGSYRTLAATANNFARESFMDELAAAAGADPLEFRLAHLEPGRLRDVLVEVARRFNWTERVKQKSRTRGVGLACGTEKGSYVAACVEVELDQERKLIIPRQVCEVFECGAIINPDNLRAQVEGAIIMGLGPVLREEMRFENGRMLNASFAEYQTPRLKDVPELDIHLLNRPDLASAGGGETPIIAVAPAIGNAICHATGVRLRDLPMRFPETKGS
jgi:CO/xanthine dehydrogenase Mo-binding subunit